MGSRALELVVPTLHDNLVGAVNVLVAAAEVGNVRVVGMGSLQEPDEPTGAGLPSSPYAASKYAASAYARMFAELYSLPATVARVPPRSSLPGSDHSENAGSVVGSSSINRNRIFLS